MNIEKNCAACGRPITVRLADHKRGWGKFCDKACSAAYKCGQRPKDVNRHHAKFSPWAADRMAQLEADGVTAWAKAPSIESQIGKKPKVRHKLHSPPTMRHCRECGDPSGEELLCMECDALNATAEGWDGHKHG